MLSSGDHPDWSEAKEKVREDMNIHVGAIWKSQQDSNMLRTRHPFQDAVVALDLLLASRRDVAIALLLTLDAKNEADTRKG